MGGVSTDNKSSKTKKPRQGTGVYTMADVAEHNTLDNCWMIYHDRVLDVSGWVTKHPGSPKTIMRFAGQDATDEIRQMHPDWVIDKKLPLFDIGRVTDAPEPTPVQKTFRELYVKLQDLGYFNYDDHSYYYKKAVCYAPLFLAAVYLVVATDSNALHLLSAVLMAAFFWQMAFIGHDLGHMTGTGNRKLDYDIGLFVGDFMTGISVGWWKLTHNVHHAVPNSLHSDPDIAHLPVFAVDTRMFEGLYNTYHGRVMEFDAFAQMVVPYQAYLYYPIMFFARFNLYLQSVIMLVKDPYHPRRLEESIAMAGFFVWQYLLLKQLNSWPMVFAYLMLENGLSAVLHVQITLSHFSMPVYDDFAKESETAKDKYGGDFFSRNVLSSLDVSCPEYMDWVHGGLQFQTEHHCFPRLSRRFLRKSKPLIKAACAKHGLPWNEMGFIDCNKDVIRVLQEAANKSKTWSPMIGDTFNARG